MIDAWIVVRTEKHVDDNYWVCLSKEDALHIALIVTCYWRDQYEESIVGGHVEVDQDLYDDMLYHYTAEDLFSVYVLPTSIREPGETEPLG